MPITITEALAEIKTIGKRLEKKREAVLGLLGRQDGLKDPLEKEGGSVAWIAGERQSIGDLEVRVLNLRRGIQRANDMTMVQVADANRSISDWLVWRRDVAPKQKEFLGKLRANISGGREQAKRAGVSIIGPGETATKLQDLVINISEVELIKDIERLETTLGGLDGVLSLKNATVSIVET